jgi:hypothetical protein
MVSDEIAVRLFVRACGEFVMESFPKSFWWIFLGTFDNFQRMSFQQVLLNELSSCF